MNKIFSLLPVIHEPIPSMLLSSLLSSLCADWWTIFWRFPLLNRFTVSPFCTVTIYLPCCLKYLRFVNWYPVSIFSRAMFPCASRLTTELWNTEVTKSSCLLDGRDEG